MKKTIYVVTYYDFNHKKRGVPIDSRFFHPRGNYHFFLIDKNCPEQLKGQNVLFEHEIDDDLHVAGGKTLGEWTFLLAEAKHGFCDYPFYMTSSRFYEKNNWLYRDLNEEWDTLFGYLNEYGWGYLPSYDRPLRWIDFKRSERRKQIYKHRVFYPLKRAAFDVIQELYGTPAPRFVSDLFCNYIGFQSREHLLEYVEFYRPLLDFFLDEKYLPKVNLNDYVQTTGKFRNEKPFTFLIEAFSHFFFHQNQYPFYALSYDGQYCVDEYGCKIKQLERFPLSMLTRFERWCNWTNRKIQTETPFLKYPLKGLAGLCKFT